MQKIFKDALRSNCALNHARRRSRENDPGGTANNDYNDNNDKKAPPPPPPHPPSHPPSSPPPQSSPPPSPPKPPSFAYEISVSVTSEKSKSYAMTHKSPPTKSSSASLVLSEVPRIQKLIIPDDIETEALEILQVVRPQWFEQQLNHESQITTTILTGGITNKLFAFYRETDPEPRDTVVIKVYGENTEKIIDRYDEIETIQFLSQYDIGPQLYAVFDNGLCYEYFHGETLGPEKITSPQIYPLVAEQIAHLHSIPLALEQVESDMREASTSVSKQSTTKSNKASSMTTTSSSTSAMWNKMRQYLSLLEYEILVINPELRDKLENDAKFTVEKAKSNIEVLENLLEKQDMPIAVCHNDLLHGNMIYNEPEQTVKLIDFEYAMPNYIPYDVANHFNEFANSGDGMPDYSKLPDTEFKKLWIEAYLRAYINDKEEEIVFSQKDFEKWVELCSPASHLFWTLWGAVQAGQSDIDFDYMGYACLRYGQYEKDMQTISRDDFSFYT